jgi:hypothetical protein
MPKTKVRNVPTHGIKFEYDLGNGERHVQVHPVKVRLAVKPVVLELKAEDILASMKANGIANSLKCSMAMCCRREVDKFPHPYVGPIDWFKSTAFVVSKQNKNGIPTEAYRYKHRDDIAKYNDSKAGYQRLLKMVEAGGGSVPIKLLPSPSRAGQQRTGVPMGKTTGTRRKPGATGRFMKQRFASNVPYPGLDTKKKED